MLPLTICTTHELIEILELKVLVQEDFDDINSASSGCLSPDLGEVWRYVIVHDNIFEEEGSATSSTFSSESTMSTT